MDIYPCEAVPNVVALSLAGASPGSPHISEILRCFAFFSLLSCPGFFSRTSAQVEPLERLDGFSRLMAQTTFSPNDVPFGGQNNES